jgi:acyl dehydratase
MYLVKFCSSLRSTVSFRWERDMSTATTDSLTASYVRALIPKCPRTRPRSLASLALTREAGAASPARLDAYRQLCAFPISPVLPITYPHLTAFPMAMSLITRRDFPFPVLGLVHIRNVIEQPRPISAAESLTFHVSIAQPYEHPRGSAFDVTADARGESGEIVWHSVSTYLHVQVHKADSGIRPDPTPLPPTWHLPADLGRRYASISGDRNPIHLYPWTARLFGFPRQIAHGMWTMARCVAALELADPAAAIRASVDFRAPVRLPSEVTFTASPAAADDAAATDFVLQASSTGRIHLTGRLTSL